MACNHPDVHLTISWVVEMSSVGPEVMGSQVQDGSLRVVVSCPDCKQSGNVYTSVNGWRERWPTWLCNRVRQLAEGNPTLRQAVMKCLPGLILPSYVTAL
jgi:hypothetical protein